MRRTCNQVRDFPHRASDEKRRVAQELPVHQRERVRGPSRQGLRPDLGRGGRSLLPRRAEGRLDLWQLRVACETLATTNRVVIAGETRGPETVTKDWIAHVARMAIKDIGYEQDGFHWEKADDRGAAARPVGPHRPGRRRIRQQGRGRGRPGHHVRLRLPRDARADAGADPLLPQDPAATRRGPPLRQGAGARARRQEPGHGALRGRQAGRASRRSWSRPSTSIESRRRRQIARASSSPTSARRCPTAGSTKDYGLARQPDRQVRHRRTGRRLRPHRPQDHRRHLRRRGPARRRRLLRQGPDQGRPLGGLRGALSGQERRGGRACRPLHHPALLRHRRGQAAVDLRRPATAPARSTWPSSRRRWAR